MVLLMGFAASGKRTVGEALCKETGFTFVHHHAWMDPILNLLGQDASVFLRLNESAWGKINEAREVAGSCGQEKSTFFTHQIGL